jgi:hypothetical protein
MFLNWWAQPSRGKPMKVAGVGAFFIGISINCLLPISYYEISGPLICHIFSLLI